MFIPDPGASGVKNSRRRKLVSERGGAGMVVDYHLLSMVEE
jgi:hypothetical protein